LPACKTSSHIKWGGGLTSPGAGRRGCDGCLEPYGGQAAGLLDFSSFTILPPRPGAGPLPGESWFGGDGRTHQPCSISGDQASDCANSRPTDPSHCHHEYGIWPRLQDPGLANLAGRLHADPPGLLQSSSDSASLAASWNLHGSNPTAAIAKLENGAGHPPHYMSGPHHESFGLPWLGSRQFSTFACQVTNVKSRSAFPPARSGVQFPERSRLP